MPIKFILIFCFLFSSIAFGKNANFENYRIGDGTVTAPSLQFRKDSNTGIYRKGTNNLAITLGGTDTLDLTTTSVTSSKDFFAPRLDIDNIQIDSNTIFSSSGSIILTPASTLRINDSSIGTSGECFISTDTLGNGNWDTCPLSPSAANINLSNLSSTAINVDLIFGAAVEGELSTADNGAGDSEDLLLRVGTATGTRGVIKLIDASIGTSGECWVSTGVGGEGNWDTCPGGGGGSGGNNFIINGGFELFQRGTAATTSDGFQTADRFETTSQGDYLGFVEQRQETDSPNLVTKFALNARTTAAIGANVNNFSRIQYSVEGFDYNEIINQATILTFYVKSNVTGIKNVVVKNATSGATNRSYVSEYTIDVADTWEKETILIDANGTLGVGSDTNGTGLVIAWVIANEINSIDTATPDTWLNGNFWTTSNHVDHNGINDFIRITQVKLEIGSTATEWSRAGGTIGGEIAAAQRYYQKSYEINTDPSTATILGSINFRNNGTNDVGNLISKVSMRALPTVIVFNPVNTNNNWRDITAGADEVINILTTSENGFHFSVSSGIDQNHIRGHWSMDAEL